MIFFLRFIVSIINRLGESAFERSFSKIMTDFSGLITRQLIGQPRLNGLSLPFHWLVATRYLFITLISRPGRSQGLLYKHLCY